MINQNKLIQTIGEGIDYDLSELLFWNAVEDKKRNIRNARVEGYKEGYIIGYQQTHSDENDVNMIKKTIKLLEEGYNYNYISKITNKKICEIENLDKKIFLKEDRSNDLLLPKCYDYVDRCRVNNALLFFKLPEFKDEFILFVLGDRDDFTFDNVIIEELRLAYIVKDEYGGSRVEPIKDDNKLNSANKKAREFLYDENCLARISSMVLTYQ